MPSAPNAHELAYAEYGMALGTITRHAVATLEEAREHTRGIIGDTYCRTGDALDAEWCAALDAELPGTVGPLPDGTVIQVERVDWNTSALRHAVAMGLSVTPNPPNPR